MPKNSTVAIATSQTQSFNKTAPKRAILLAQFAQWFESDTNYQERFQWWRSVTDNAHAPDMSNIAGYKRMVRNDKPVDATHENDAFEDCEMWFYVYPDVFKNEICKGFDYRILVQMLIERGVIIADNGRFTKRVRLPSGEVCNMYVFNSAVFDIKPMHTTPEQADNERQSERVQSHAQGVGVAGAQNDLTQLCTTIAICEALVDQAIELDNAARGLLCLRVVVSNGLDNEKSRLMRGGVSVLSGIDFVRAVPVFMPWIADKADHARLNCGGDVSKLEPYLLCDGREYAFDINSANELVTVELFINAFAVTSDWLVENIADMFERLAFEIDAGIEFVNQRRERGYFNA